MNNRVMLLDHLRMAERHVEEGEGRVRLQEMLIAQLNRDGRDTASAADLLRVLKETLALAYMDRVRLRRELELDDTQRWRP